MPAFGHRKTHCIRGHDLRFARWVTITKDGWLYWVRKCQECHLIHVRKSQIKAGVVRR